MRMRRLGSILATLGCTLLGLLLGINDVEPNLLNVTLCIVGMFLLAIGAGLISVGTEGEDEGDTNSS